MSQIFPWCTLQFMERGGTFYDKAKQLFVLFHFLLLLTCVLCFTTINGYISFLYLYHLVINHVIFLCCIWIVACRSFTNKSCVLPFYGLQRRKKWRGVSFKGEFRHKSQKYTHGVRKFCWNAWKYFKYVHAELLLNRLKYFDYLTDNIFTNYIQYWLLW